MNKPPVHLIHVFEHRTDLYLIPSSHFGNSPWRMHGPTIRLADSSNDSVLGVALQQTIATSGHPDAVSPLDDPFLTAGVKSRPGAGPTGVKAVVIAVFEDGRVDVTPCRTRRGWGFEYLRVASTEAASPSPAELASMVRRAIELAE